MMKINQINLKNFKKFADFSLDLHPQFTLLVGENDTGKTSILDALAIAAGIWLVDPPDSILKKSGRNILPQEIRLEGVQSGDRIQFIERSPVEISAIGSIGNSHNIHWIRSKNKKGVKTSNTEAREALKITNHLFQEDQRGQKIWFPVIAYYGAGRAWLPSSQPENKTRANFRTNAARRWQAFYHCFDERIRLVDVQTWFLTEAITAVNNKGEMRLGYKVVKSAILNCIPNASDLWFDGDRGEIVIMLEDEIQPISHLSSGLKMMFYLVADIAIKIVTQNASFLTEEIEVNQTSLPIILQRTSGLILIDEIDVHLHPKWQRRIVNDLKKTFPSIQFISTTHSPIVISEVPAESIRFLTTQGAVTPTNAFGLDVNRILDELMGVSERSQETTQAIHHIFQLIDDEAFEAANQSISQLEEQVGELDPDITRAHTLIHFLQEES